MIKKGIYFLPGFGLASHSKTGPAGPQGALRVTEEGVFAGNLAKNRGAFTPVPVHLLLPLAMPVFSRGWFLYIGMIAVFLQPGLLCLIIFIIAGKGSYHLFIGVNNIRSRNI